MMESSETFNTTEPTNPPAETLAIASTSDLTVATQTVDPNEQKLEVKSDNSPDIEVQKQPEGEEINKYLSANLEKDEHEGTETLAPTGKTIELLPNEKEIGIFGMLGVSQANKRTIYKLLEVYRLLADFYNKKSLKQISYSHVWQACEHIKPALDLIDRLSKDIEKYRQELQIQDKTKQRLEREKHQLEQYNHDCQRSYGSLEKRLQDITADRDNLYRTRQNFEANYRQHLQNIQQEADRKLANYHQQNSQRTQEFERIKQEKQTSDRNFTELEASRNKLLAEVASLKRNTGTHYDGTSDRPQHHILTGEYKTLKEQNLDPLADSLFKFIAATNPELKPQRREKVNDIKAAISAIVLIGGQAIMRGESTSSKELPSGMLDEMQNFLRQQLKLPNQNFLQQVSELLTKAANLAQGNVQCPVPGKWQEQDFQVVSAEMSDRLCQLLKLNFTTLNQDIQTEMQKAIQNALRFLERAAIADPPAYLSLDNEGAPFRYDYHEAAKGYDEEGKIVKAIYPIYLVNSEAKVKAIVLTEPSTQLTPDTSPPCTSTETSSSSASASSPAALEQKSTENQVDETEKIRLDGKLEGKRETLIKNVTYKWIDTPDPIDHTSENELLEKLSKINRLDIIEELEKEFHKVYSLPQFKEKVRHLLG